MHIYGGILSHRGYEYFYIIGYEKVPRGEGMEVRRTFPIILYAFLCNLCVIKALIAKKKIFFFFRRMCFYIKFNERSEKKDEANAFPIPLYYFGLTFQERSTLISQFRFPTDLHPPGMTTWRRVKVSRDASQRDHKGTGLVVIFADNIDQSCQTLAL